MQHCSGQPAYKVVALKSVVARMGMGKIQQ